MSSYGPDAPGPPALVKRPFGGLQMRFFAPFALALSLGCASSPPAPTPAAAPAVSVLAAPDAGAPPAALHAPVPPVPLAQYLETRRVFGGTFSHDDKQVAYGSDEGGRPD